jgi:hypothetical protein
LNEKDYTQTVETYKNALRNDLAMKKHDIIMLVKKNAKRKSIKDDRKKDDKKKSDKDKKEDKRTTRKTAKKTIRIKRRR